MRRLFLVLLVVVVSKSFVAGQDWQFEIIDSTTNPFGNVPLVLDDSGSPNVFAYNFDSNSLTRYYKDGQEWQRIDYGIDFRPQGAIYNGQGSFHLCSTDYYSLNYLYISTDSISSETLDAGQFQIFANSSVDVDEYGQPHIIYDEHTSGDIRYVYKDSSGWHWEIIASGTQYYTSYTELLINGANFHAIVLDQSGPDNIIYFKKQAGEWISDILFTGYISSSINMELDPEGRPGIFFSYQDGGNSINSYLSFTGTDWDTTIISDFYGNTEYAPFTYDSENQSHFIQFLRRMPNEPKMIIYTYPENSGWQSDTILTGYFYPLSLKGDGENRLRLIYRKYNSGDLGLYSGVLDLETGVENQNSILIDDEMKINRIYPNPFNNTVSIEFEIFDSHSQLEFSVYDILGERVYNRIIGPYVTGDHHLTWDGKDSRGRESASGYYFLSFRGDGFVNNAKVVLLR